MSDHKLGDLLDMSLIQTLAESNFRASGLPMSMIDAFDMSVLVRAGWTDICTKFHRACPATQQRCKESDASIVGKLVKGEALRYKCKNGLWHVAIPIIVAGKHLATMFLTQFYFEGEIPERDYFVQQAKQFGYDEAAYLAALDKLPIFSVEKVNYILAYDKALVQFIEGLAEQALKVIDADQKLRKMNEELEDRVVERTKQLEATNTDLRHVTQRLELAYGELKSAQSRILQQEKMASIGQLAAGVAHEINNPMGFIISNLNSLQRYIHKILEFMKIQSETIEKVLRKHSEQCCELYDRLLQEKQSMKMDYIVGDLEGLVKESLEGADRVRKIVQDLKSFSRVDGADFSMEDINAGIESTINIVWNELKYKATLKKELGVLPRTRCNLGQLNQVFMNILLNAAHAIREQGEIGVKTWSSETHISIAISDTGTGIPAENLNKIFEPFFTTKPVGHGTGLGLSVAYDIIKQHHGEIKVESEVGKGTTFTIQIPIIKE